MATEVDGQISLKVYNNLFAMTSLQKLSIVTFQPLTSLATLKDRTGFSAGSNFPVTPCIPPPLPPTQQSAWPASNLQLSTIK